MSQKPLSYFKSKFKAGYKITEDDYADWLDSFRHKEQPVPLADTSGLESLLAAYRKTADQIPASEVSGLTAFVSQMLSNYLTTSSQISQSQVEGLTEQLEHYPTWEEIDGHIDNKGITIDQTAIHFGGGTGLLFNNSGQISEWEQSYFNYLTGSFAIGHGGGWFGYERGRSGPGRSGQFGNDYPSAFIGRVHPAIEESEYVWVGYPDAATGIHVSAGASTVVIYGSETKIASPMLTILNHIRAYSSIELGTSLNGGLSNVWLDDYYGRVVALHAPVGMPIKIGEVVTVIDNSLSFHGQEPVGQQVLPLGSAIDDVIQALQNLGLVREQ